MGKNNGIFQVPGVYFSKLFTNSVKSILTVS